MTTDEKIEILLNGQHALWKAHAIQLSFDVIAVVAIAVALFQH